MSKIWSIAWDSSISIVWYYPWRGMIQASINLDRRPVTDPTDQSQNTTKVTLVNEEFIGVTSWLRGYRSRDESEAATSLKALPPPSPLSVLRDSQKMGPRALYMTFRQLDNSLSLLHSRCWLYHLGGRMDLGHLLISRAPSCWYQESPLAVDGNSDQRCSCERQFLIPMLGTSALFVSWVFMSFPLELCLKGPPLQLPCSRRALGELSSHNATALNNG